MRLVYFGSGAFGLPTLERLFETHDLALVVTQPDRPAGRGRRLTATPVAAFATERHLETIKPDRVNTPDTVAAIRSGRADAFVVIAYGHKIGPALLDGVFAINLHASLLPKYRGAAPINHAIMNGEHETGVSVITVVDRMDAGDVLAQTATPIDPSETAGELHDRLAALGPAVVLETLRRRAEGTLEPRPQDESAVSQAPKLSKADGDLHFDQPAESVRRQVHGLSPWPGCSARLGGVTMRIRRVSAVETPEIPGGPPGELLRDYAVRCAAGAVRLSAVVPAGGREMSLEDFCRGRRIEPGARMERR